MIAALIGSRICHDLISPIGAISNGLELATFADNAPLTPEMALVQQSCDNATARIRFFRIAFGSAGGVHQISANETRSALSDYFRDSRISPEWTIDDGVSRGDVQRAFLGVLCLESELPQGGKITVSIAPEHLVLNALGTLRTELGAQWSCFETPRAAPPTLTPADVQFALLAQLCAQDGVRVSAEMVQDEVNVVIPRCTTGE